MNSLLLGLALSSSPATAAQPPLPPALPPGTPVTGQFQRYPTARPPAAGPYRPGYPARPVSDPYQYQYGDPGRQSLYPDPLPPQSSPLPLPSPVPPAFAPGEPPPGLPVHTGPMTLAQFARCFHPTPGHHTVCLIHPITCQPVHVCFDLPCDCGHPRIEVNRRSIEFDYGRREIEIEFKRNGRYEVDYD